MHHHLVREGTRTRCSLIVESGEAREVHHMALLLGYGAGAINPYLAFETLQDMVNEGQLAADDFEAAVRAYIKACTKGVLKVMSKMGISTLQSYRGAQIFEAVGLDKAFVDRYFTWTASRVGGIGIDTVADETVRRHRQGYPQRGTLDGQLDTGGEYQWRRDGEYHLFNPDTVFKLQHASRSGQFSIYREYAELVNDQSRKRATLRGLFKLRPGDEPIPIDEVEPAREHPEAVRDRRHVVRLHQPGGARDAGHRDEPARRQVEYRRGRRGFRALHARPERRPAAQRGQAGGLRALRGHQRVPGQLGRHPDQDGAGCEARRGRTAPGVQGVPVDSQGALFDAGRGTDLASAAP